MKTGKSKSKLNLTKLQITKINNYYDIRGGIAQNDMEQTEEGRSYRPDCPTESTLC